MCDAVTEPSPEGVGEGDTLPELETDTPEVIESVKDTSFVSVLLTEIVGPDGVT